MGKKSQQKKGRRIQEGKISQLPADVPWTSFEPAFVDGEHRVWDGTHWFEVYKNSRYTICKRSFRHESGGPDLVHLSIKRTDRKPVTSWRDLQKIKNELVGPECEGVQLFPAESRLVDNANQNHVFVVNDPTFRFPFGYKERVVSEGNLHGSVQEPFEDHVRPPDLIPPDFMDEKLREFHQVQADGRIPIKMEKEG